MIWPRVRREGDLGNADLGRGAVDHSLPDAGVRDIGLQQMRANAAYLLSQRARGFAYRAAGEHDRAGGEGAEAIWPNRRIAVADRNACGVDPQLMRADLRQRGLMSLAMVLHAYVDQHAAIRQHADICRFITRDDAKLAFDEFHRAVTTLLGVKRKPHADPASVRLARRLSVADRW